MKARPALAATIALAASLVLAPAGRAQLAGGLQAPQAESLVHVSAALVRIPTGGTAIAAVEITVQAGWHVNANPPSPDYMIPTDVTVEAAGGVHAGKGEYPPPNAIKVGFEPNPILTLSGTFTVRLPRAPSWAAGCRRRRPRAWSTSPPRLCASPRAARRSRRSRSRFRPAGT